MLSVKIILLDVEKARIMERCSSTQYFIVCVCAVVFTCVI